MINGLTVRTSIGFLCGLLLSSGAQANGLLTGFSVEVPEGFTVVESSKGIELRASDSFCAVIWREVLTTSVDTGSISPDGAATPSAAISRSGYTQAGVDYVLWTRVFRGPVASIEGTATCPAWSATGVEPVVVGILESAQLNRSAIDEAFAGLPFIAKPPQGFAVSRRFANSLVLAATDSAIPEGTSITLSSLQTQRGDISFAEFSTALLSNQRSVSDVVITSQRNMLINGYRGHHLLASGVSTNQSSRIHQVVLGNSEQMVLVTMTAPALDKTDGKQWSLAREQTLLTELLASLRLR